MSSVKLPAQLQSLQLKPNGFEIISAQGEVFNRFADSKASAYLVCHLPYMRGKIRTLPNVDYFDVLELYAFVYPTTFAAPSPMGLAQALGLDPSLPHLLFDIAAVLLKTKLSDKSLAIAANMTHWPWRVVILENHGYTKAPDTDNPLRAFSVWHDLPETAQATTTKFETAQTQSLTGDEARQVLSDLLTRQSSGGKVRQHRQAQANYTTRLSAAFSSEDTVSILAEAGTGVGKTLGYLAPSYAFAEKNNTQVWVSTYTKNLQRQIEQEFKTLYPNPDERARKVIIRKGRENYLCLLNFQEQIAQSVLGLDPKALVTAGLLTRFVMETHDGDLTGSSFHGWLPGLLGVDSTTFADRRGECIYAGCDHFDRCFIERNKRRAVNANLVVSNHAVLMREAISAAEKMSLPSRYVLDEGHHLFDAADEAYGTSLTLQSLAELRRWILGPEGGLARKRGRSLTRRLQDLITDDGSAQDALRLVLRAAMALPAQGAASRLENNSVAGDIEPIFVILRDVVNARTQDTFYSAELEPELWPESLRANFEILLEKLQNLFTPMVKLVAALTKAAEGVLVSDPITADRILSLSDTIHNRAYNNVGAWIKLLQDYVGIHEKNQGFIDWLEVTRTDGKVYDIGIQRRYLNPMHPFAESLKPHVKGLVITSATLRDGLAGDDEENWAAAEERTGLTQLSHLMAQRVSVASPFNYAQQSLVLIILDVPKNAPSKQVDAYLQLFMAAKGGALGLFTAVSRLKQVAASLRDHLPYPLFAQHVDAMDVGTLVDMFRADEHSCLLGTDAVRDGVDVPGRSLRLLVMERIPWPRLSYINRVRRVASGNARDYDLRITRLKLKQAFGRLIRSETDKGVFVLLESSLPSSLHSAFPEGVQVQRVTLNEATKIVQGFLD